jgi:hypothetical protein
VSWSAPSSDSSDGSDDFGEAESGEGSGNDEISAGAAGGGGELGAGGFTSFDCYIAHSVEEDSQRAGEIVARWRANKSVYSVPRGNNDDWFWMYAAVSQPNPSATRLISNDYMRDHHFHVFSSWSTFQTWRERHQVQFAVLRQLTSHGSPVTGGGAGANATLQLRFPLPYSFRMQPSEDGRAWHFPLARAPAAKRAVAGSAADCEAAATSTSSFSSSSSSSSSSSAAASSTAATSDSGSVEDEWIVAWAP